jgi:hypothetical protein
MSDGLGVAGKGLGSLGALVGVAPATAELAAVEFLLDLVHAIGGAFQRAVGQRLDLDRYRIVLLDDTGNQRLDVLLELFGAGQ